MVILLHIESLFTSSLYIISCAVELDYMWAIPWDILPLTFYRDTSVCKVSMFYIQWDGMRLGFLLNNMLSRFASHFLGQISHSVYVPFTNFILHAQTGTHPKITTKRNIERFRSQVLNRIFTIILY